MLEAHLLAALPASLRHLVLIGDHQQLRPCVTTHRLSRCYGFDMSMMERLIGIGLPYTTLQTQSRMRPEMSRLLLDIYPALKVPLENYQCGVFWVQDPLGTGR